MSLAEIEQAPRRRSTAPGAAWCRSGGRDGAAGSWSARAWCSPTPTTCGAGDHRHLRRRSFRGGDGGRVRPRRRPGRPAGRHRRCARHRLARRRAPGAARRLGDLRPQRRPGGAAAQLRAGQLRGPGLPGARGRRISGSLEHTAPLPRGASGGPVVDATGRLVRSTPTASARGLPRVPADAALRRVEALAAGRAPARRRLGVALAPPRSPGPPPQRRPARAGRPPRAGRGGRLAGRGRRAAGGRPAGRGRRAGAGHHRRPPRRARRRRRRALRVAVVRAARR